MLWHDLPGQGRRRRSEQTSGGLRGVRVSLLPDAEGEKVSAFSQKMQSVLNTYGFRRKEICAFSKEVVEAYSTEELKLHELTEPTLSRMLKSARQTCTREKVLTFYLSCYCLAWKQLGESGPKPTLEDAHKFYAECASYSEKLTNDRRSHHSTRRELIGATENINYDEFNIEQRRSISRFGEHGLELQRLAARGDTQAAFALGILHLLSGGFVDARRRLDEASAGGIGDASAFLMDIASSNSRQRAAGIATKFARSHRQYDLSKAMIYFELAAQNQDVDAADHVINIYEDRESPGEAIRWFEEAKNLGHLDAQRRIEMINAELSERDGF